MIALKINPDTIFLQSNHENLIAKSSQSTKWKPERFEIQPRNPISSTTARFIARPLTRNVGESPGQWSEWRGHTTRIKLIPISHRAKDSASCRHSPGLSYPLGNHLIQIITRLIIRRQVSLSYVNQNIHIFVVQWLIAMKMTTIDGTYIFIVGHLCILILDSSGIIRHWLQANLE